ncbi:MAG: 2-oxoacid:acceptor oxidoreductase family protein, partial [Candidatus Caldarchaeum sp.]
MRFHGRGGQGVKTSSRILGRAAFLAGYVAQDSPIYGAERRGAPVYSFARISDKPVRLRSQISEPDILVVLDRALLRSIPFKVKGDGMLLANAPSRPP